MVQRRMSIARPLAVIAILMLNAPAFARDDTGKVYRCETKDAVSVQKDGTLSKLLGEHILKPFDKIVIDVESGHISYPSSGNRDEWIVEKPGSDDDDYVLFPSSARRFGMTAARAVTHFIRVRTTDTPPRFILVTLSYLVSGTCELAHD
jgi:hypothetical protein